MFGVPSVVLVTTFAAPAIVMANATPGPKERLPGYWTGVGWTALAASGGLALSFAVHAALYPDSTYGNGKPHDDTAVAAFFSVPPIVLGATGSALTFTLGRSTVSATPTIRSTSGGLTLTFVGTF